MSDKLLNLLKNIENLNKEELEKVQTWVDFVLKKNADSTQIS